MRRLGVEGYHELHRISIEEPDRFWPEVIEDLGLVFSRRWGLRGVGASRGLHRIWMGGPARFWRGVMEDLGLVFSRRWDSVVDTSRGIEWATWFNGAELNLAESCVHRWVDGRGNDEAAV